MAMENAKEVLQKVRESLEFWYLRILSPVSSHNFVKVNSCVFSFHLICYLQMSQTSPSILEAGEKIRIWKRSEYICFTPLKLFWVEKYFRAKGKVQFFWNIFKRQALSWPSFFYPLRWLIYVFNSVVNTKLPAILSHRRSTTVSLETYPFTLLASWFFHPLTIKSE